MDEHEEKFRESILFRILFIRSTCKSNQSHREGVDLKESRREKLCFHHGVCVSSTPHP